MRKTLSILLCLALCLTLGTAALASGEASGGAFVASNEAASSVVYGYAGGGTLEASGPVSLPNGEQVIENAVITGVNGSAIQNSGTSDLIVRDSVVAGLSTAPTAPLAGNPGNLLVAGDVRATLALSQAHSFYVNSTIIGTNWAALSTDGAVPATEAGQSELSLYAYGSLANTYNGGYGAYSDLFCNLYVYGSEIDAGEIGVISGTYGRVVVGTIADGEADPVMAAHLSPSDVDTHDAKTLGSIVAGGRNAIMIHSVNLPPYWEYEGYSQDELPLYATPVTVNGSTLKTNAGLDKNISYDAQKQAYIDHTAGSVILIKSTNTDITLENSELLPDPNGTGAIIHSVYNNDTMFMNAVPDGTFFPGMNISIIDMSVTGDVISEDYQRDMYLTLENASLTGAVNAYDCAHWNAAAQAEGFTDYALDASYETPHGIYLTLADGAEWTVTGESTLMRLAVGEGCSVAGTMTVDGAAAPILPGTYEGVIVITP